MSPEERLDLIDELRRKTDERRENIRRREEALEAEREADPCKMQDRLIAEHDQWMAQHEPQGSPPVSETDDAGLLYRSYDNSALETALEPEPEPFDQDTLADSVAKFVITRIRRERVVYDRKIAGLEGELREVKGMLGAVLQLLGKSGTVVELPKKRATNE
jgi:hypothetical protein